ncbi:LysR family transcriptional regulator [Cobetia marina]
MNLNYLKVFIEIARQGSMLGASGSLGIPNSTIGRQLSQLEKELDVRLISRNTRHLSLTEDGKELFEKTAHLIDHINEIENDTLYRKNGLSGKINISIPNEFGTIWLSSCIAKFAKRHPMISLDCSTSMVSVNPMREDMDVSIIYHRGIPDDSSLIMKNLVSIPSVVVGSKEIIQKYGLPTQVSDMNSVPCISTLYALRANPWHFIDHYKNHHSQRVNCNYRVDSSNLLISAAAEGVGFAIIPQPFCQKLIDQGKLVKIELDMEPAPLHLAAIFPNRIISTRTRKLVDEIKRNP